MTRQPPRLWEAGSGFCDAGFVGHSFLHWLTVEGYWFSACSLCTRVRGEDKRRRIPALKFMWYYFLPTNSLGSRTSQDTDIRDRGADWSQRLTLHIVRVTFPSRQNISLNPQYKPYRVYMFSHLSGSFLTSFIRFNVVLQRDLPPRGSCTSQKVLLWVLICVASLPHFPHPSMDEDLTLQSRFSCLCLSCPTFL